MLAIAGSLVDWLMQVQSWFRHSDWQFSISRGAVQERSNFKLSKGREEQKKRWIGSFFKALCNILGLSIVCWGFVLFVGS
jgi:hypothetical protein